MNQVGQIRHRFRDVFAGESRIFRAPGRVNLIGEHTDYNDGFVMPAAIGYYAWVAAASRADRVLSVYSQNFDEQVDFDLDESGVHRLGSWSDYVRGVAAMIDGRNGRLLGANVYVAGDVPMGAGLSSSAALEVATGLALSQVSGLPIDRKELALACRQAESDFVGTRCGIMDQFISCFGEKDKALMLDCRSLEYRLMSVDPAARIVVCNSMVKHELAAGEYNTRRSECEEGVRLIRRRLPGTKALRDVSLEQWADCGSSLPEVLARRCRHVISENDRVIGAAAALDRNDLEEFGRLMYRSHESLRRDYEVSCRELDVLVDLARGIDGVYGARMTGGGFGGCTVNLVRADEVERFAGAVIAGYRAVTGIIPAVLVCTAAAGAIEVTGGEVTDF